MLIRECPGTAASRRFESARSGVCAAMAEADEGGWADGRDARWVINLAGATY
ncbi:hypothetical protein MBOT_25290 [Mycobacterium botniense]|uniref:Uncharacterized protein n=1 Tax=Mycobacterium botniense TaxID=84962 RepID=A0A7I9XZG4_9MYCO|nr:hypothetical protein MBOT_25290 [Mycobacterium botniense]